MFRTLGTLRESILLEKSTCEDMWISGIRAGNEWKVLGSDLGLAWLTGDKAGNDATVSTGTWWASCVSVSAHLVLTSEVDSWGATILGKQMLM